LGKNLSNIITNSLSTVGYWARIYLVSAHGESESELVDFSSSEVAPKKTAHKNIHICKPAIVACPRSHIM
jgi:hypothetical protein